MKYTLAPRQASQPNFWGYRLASMAILGLLLFNLPGPIGGWKSLLGPQPPAPLPVEKTENQKPGLDACLDAGEAPHPGVCSDDRLGECVGEAIPGEGEETDGQTAPRCKQESAAVTDSN